MKLREYHPLSEMERVPAEELPKRLDELFDRMDKENVGFVVTEEGKDSCVFCPYKWFELEYETIEVAVDEVLLAQIKEIITPLGWTVSCICLCNRFMSCSWFSVSKYLDRSTDTAYLYPSSVYSFTF